MSDDPILKALDSVDEPGSEMGAPIGEEPDARPEGPLGDMPADELGDDPGDEDNFAVLSWLKSVPDGSHRDYDAADFWDPEGGGETRLAYHLSSAAGDGIGYPNGIGLLVGIAELYVSMARNQAGGSGDEPDEPPESGAETVARKTAEGLV